MTALSTNGWPVKHGAAGSHQAEGNSSSAEGMMVTAMVPLLGCATGVGNVRGHSEWLW